MQMIRHQAVRRAGQFFADTRMKQNLPELVVKTVVQPAGSCRFNPHGPVDGGKGLIVRALQPCEMVEVRVTHVAKLLHAQRKVSRILWLCSSEHG